MTVLAGSKNGFGGREGGTLMGLKGSRRQAGCVVCGRLASFAVAFHVSTLGVWPRRQSMTPSERYCDACIHALCATNEDRVSHTLCEALRAAYTKLARSPESDQDEP